MLMTFTCRRVSLFHVPIGCGRKKQNNEAKLNNDVRKKYLGKRRLCTRLKSCRGRIRIIVMPLVCQGVINTSKMLFIIEKTPTNQRRMRSTPAGQNWRPCSSERWIGERDRRARLVWDSRTLALQCSTSLECSKRRPASSIFYFGFFSRRNI